MKLTFLYALVVFHCCHRPSCELTKHKSQILAQYRQICIHSYQIPIAMENYAKCFFILEEMSNDTSDCICSRPTRKRRNYSNPLIPATIFLFSYLDRKMHSACEIKCGFGERFVPLRQNAFQKLIVHSRRTRRSTDERRSVTSLYQSPSR